MTYAMGSTVFYDRGGETVERATIIGRTTDKRGTVWYRLSLRHGTARTTARFLRCAS